MSTTTASHDLVRLRADALAALAATDAAGKARESIIRSCSQIAGLPAADLESLRTLLRCVTDQRKRLRALRRVWLSLDELERPSAELAEATGLCLRECRELAAALEPWRQQTIDQVTRTVLMTWTRLASSAVQFTAGTPGRPCR